jgi:hypothetical protein
LHEHAGFRAAGNKKFFQKIQSTPYFPCKKQAPVGNSRQNPPIFSGLLGTGSQTVPFQGSKKAPTRGAFLSESFQTVNNQRLLNFNCLVLAPPNIRSFLRFPPDFWLNNAVFLHIRF